MVEAEFDSRSGLPTTLTEKHQKCKNSTDELWESHCPNDCRKAEYQHKDCTIYRD
jgi:hypothetical protein